MRLLRDKLGIFALVLGMVFCSSFPSSVLAAAEIFKVQDVTLETADGEIIDFDEEDIMSNTKFKITGDSAKYTITIRNTDEAVHIIEDITDDNSNPNITYEYDKHLDEEIAPGADLVLVVTVKYSAYITDENDREQSNSVKFQIKFKDLPEEEFDLEVPNTGDLTAEEVVSSRDSSAVSIITPVIWFVATVALIKYGKRAKYVVAAVTTVALATSVSATAQGITAQIDEFNLNIEFTLELGRLIHYDDNWADGTMEDERLVTGGTLSPNAYTSPGYHFVGWSLICDDEVVYSDEEPMDNIPGGDEPLTLYAYWDANVYTLIFHPNAEGVTSTMEPYDIAYDSYMHIPTNKYILDDYRFVGWKIDNEGELLRDNGRIDYLEVEHGSEVHLYAQWEVAPPGINYYANGEDVVGNTSRQDSVGRTMNLKTPNYRRDGYGFAGWNTESDGTGTMYGPNEVVPTPAETLRLYATWVAPEETVTMQTFDDTAEPYASDPVGTVIALKDIRDDQVYAVAKLADNKWWMTENLRLVPTDVEFTAENTNNPAENFFSTEITESLCTQDTAECINKTAYNATNLRLSSSYTAAYEMGVYYNAFAATAGHAAVDMDNLVSGQAEGDICPKGWHLPVSGPSGDFRTLDIALGGTGANQAGNSAHAQKYFKAPINFVMAGWAEGITFRNSGSDAVYIENGYNGMKQSISVYVDIASEIVNQTTNKYDAHTVRCIAD